MKRKNNLSILVAILIGIVIWWFYPTEGGSGSGSGGFSCDFPERLNPSSLVYVNHAKCRMRCRDVDKATVESTYRSGEVNCNKSGLKNGAARYALEKRDRKGDIIRLIIEDDVQDHEHVVITVIRLGKGDLCECG